MPLNIYTTGYLGERVRHGDSKPQALLRTAERLDAIICDIRYSPVSRARCWWGENMHRVFGDRYLFVQSLGNVNYRNGGEINILAMDVGIARVLRCAEHASAVILLCACEELEFCHRNVVYETFLERQINGDSRIHCVGELLLWDSDSGKETASLF